MYAPSGAELAKETGFRRMTCAKGLQRLLREGVLVQLAQATRFRVAGAPLDAAGLELSAALAALRNAAGLTQRDLALEVGKSVTTIGHAETGRLWQSRLFWQRADLALKAGGELVARYDAWRGAARIGGGRAGHDDRARSVRSGRRRDHAFLRAGAGYGQVGRRVGHHGDARPLFGLT